MKTQAEFDQLVYKLKERAREFGVIAEVGIDYDMTFDEADVAEDDASLAVSTAYAELQSEVERLRNALTETKDTLEQALSYYDGGASIKIIVMPIKRGFMLSTNALINQPESEE